MSALVLFLSFRLPPQEFSWVNDLVSMTWWGGPLNYDRMKVDIAVFQKLNIKNDNPFSLPFIVPWWASRFALLSISCVISLSLSFLSAFLCLSHHWISPLFHLHTLIEIMSFSFCCSPKFMIKLLWFSWLGVEIYLMCNMWLSCQEARSWTEVYSFHIYSNPGMQALLGKEWPQQKLLPGPCWD